MRPAISLALLALALVLTATLALGVGTTSIDLAAALHPDALVVGIRLPRVILGGLAGAGLAAAGVAFQSILRNPLADPYVVGVSGGAALGGVLALALGLGHELALPAFAFAGAAGSGLLLFALAHAAGRTDALSLLLVGVVFNAFAAAVVTFIKTVVSPTTAQEILFWLMGVIEAQPPTLLVALAAYVAVGASVLLSAGGVLNLLSLSDEEALSLGLPVARARAVVFLAAALLVGAVVAVAGMIAFVGLVVPHVLRRLVGADNRWLLPASLLGGALFLIVADALARFVFFVFGTEIPVGVVTAFTGGPFFLVLLLRRER